MSSVPQGQTLWSTPQPPTIYHANPLKLKVERKKTGNLFFSLSTDKKARFIRSIYEIFMKAAHTSVHDII